MGVISLEQVDRLFWLGRYTERVYTTAKLYFERFDMMIDENTDSYDKFCDMIDIPHIYTSREDFLRRYAFDEENPDSIISNLNRAYDNAIVLRESIGSESLAYIQLAIYDMNRTAKSEAPLIELQQLVDHILAFWGIIDDQIDSEQVRSILKTGKRVERIDLYARLGVSEKELAREIQRLIPRVKKCRIPYNEEQLEILSSLISSPGFDYYEIVSAVESIL